MNHLQKQLKEPEHKQDAQECIEVYNWIIETDPEGKLWSSRWVPLVIPSFEGFKTTRYKLNITGKTLLLGIRESQKNN